MLSRNQTLLACLDELFGTRIKVIGLDPFTTTQFIGCDLTMETFQDYVYLLFCGIFPASGWPNLTNKSLSVLA